MAPGRGGILANGGQGIAALLLVLVPMEVFPISPLRRSGLTTLVGALVPVLAGQVAETRCACRSSADRLCWLANGPVRVTFPY